MGKKTIILYFWSCEGLVVCIENDVTCTMYTYMLYIHIISCTNQTWSVLV